MDATRYDYFDYMVLIDDALKEVEDFVALQAKEAPEYRAKTTGLSFKEMATQVAMLRDIELNNTQAIISAFMLTKDKERLISVYENNIMQSTIDLEEKQETAKSIRASAANYKKDKLVVMGKEAGEGNIEVESSSPVYDELIQQALEVEEEANQIRYDIAYYQDLLTKLTVPETIQVDVAPYIAQVDESIVYLQEQLTQVIETINMMVEEYYNVELFKSSVKRDTPAMYQSFTMEHISSNALVVVIATLLGGVLATLYVLVQGMTQTNKQKKPQGGRYEV